ncbi:DUF1178 family protein [Maricaulis sp.]|uniref:DUF1178 family protein n=1 Tax=Maricaulis sp. TaxID=1486257 RepID=UPI0026197B42|nr:DUF1178 family protein [Maricaulis sp.]
MIRYALVCDRAHEFEAWFSNSASYDDQVARDLVECPHCGSTLVRKAVMSPAVATAGRREDDIPPEKRLKQLADQVKAHIRKNFDYVGAEFAREAREMHEGKKPQRLIYGEASFGDSRQLADDGVAVTPLPDMFAPVPPKKAN